MLGMAAAEVTGPGRGRSGRPPRLSREAIVEAALDILRTEGVDALSMRRVAGRLNATPMALYSHVQDKSELLFAVLAQETDTLLRPELPTDPRARLVEVTCLLRDLLTRMPWAIGILNRREAFGGATLWMAEEMLLAARDLGLPGERAAAVFRTLWRFTTGDVLCGAGPWQPRLADEARQRRLPTLAGVTSTDSTLTSNYDFRGELKLIVDGLVKAGPDGLPR